MYSKTFARTAAAAAIFAASAVPVLAQAGSDPRDRPYYYGHGMMWGDQWGGFGMIFGPIFMILILVAIVVGIVYALKYMGAINLPSNASGSGKALDLLKDRYARGEIDHQEFDERKKRLTD